MSLPTKRLAILNCKDIYPIFDLIEEVTSNYTVSECTSKTGNKCYVVSALLDDNIKIYELLNNLIVEESSLDCRFVSDEIEFILSNIIVPPKRDDSVEIVNKESKDSLSNDDNSLPIDLYDPRFNELYTNEDFIIDTSHDEYKKCGYLKYFVEAKRNYNKK